MRDVRARLIVAGLPAKGEAVALPRKESAHVRARRLVGGDAVLLLDGSGRMAEAEIVDGARGETLVRVSRIVEAAANEAPISLLVAGIRAERLSWLVEKATEMGAGRITIVTTSRTQAFRASAGALPRLRRIACEAAKQCERNDWPSVEGPVSLERVLTTEIGSQRLLLDRDGRAFPRHIERGAAALLVGPEGGFTETERDAASSRGWQVVRLPAGKLRSETAAIAGLVLLRAAKERETG
ncbi:MAG TPA: RsmE family RNA methyltransferase [Thermoanaerobaculia bacterium]|nr:RsmE family RNA methyltransferase [Thermoanaerobaculia bacterium]